MKRIWPVAAVILLGTAVVFGCSTIHSNKNPMATAEKAARQKNVFTEEYLIFKKQDERRTTPFEF
jgi:hypothetical protein